MYGGSGVENCTRVAGRQQVRTLADWLHLRRSERI